MAIGEDRPRLVKSVHEVSRNLAPLDKIGAGYRPFRFIPYCVDRRQLLEGFLLRMRVLWPASRRGRRCLTCCVSKELIGQKSAGNGEIHPRNVDNQINRPASTYRGLAVEPPAAGDDDVVMLALRADRRAFGLGSKAVTLQHITKRNVADLVCELGDFHLLIGHPNECRASLNVLLTS